MADIAVLSGTHNLAYQYPQGKAKVWKDKDTGYAFYVDTSNNDLKYVKTTDAGLTWGSEITVSAVTLTVKFDIWADWWTNGDTGTKIHIALINRGSGNDLLYHTLDVSTDTVSTVQDIDAGYTTQNVNPKTYKISITKGRGGKVHVAGHDGGTTTNPFHYQLSGGTWTSKADCVEDVDDLLLFPAGLADSNDIWCVYWDDSASELSLKTWDDSAGNWTSISEASISTGMVWGGQQTPQMAGSVRHSDDHLILIAFDGFDSGSDDLKCWDITDASTITAKTSVITAASEIGYPALCINQQNDNLYAGYATGSNIVALTGVKYKASTNGATSWDASATDFSDDTDDDNRSVSCDISIGDNGGRVQFVWFNDDTNIMYTNNANSIEIAAASGAITKTFTIDAILQDTFTDTFTIDTILQKVFTDTFTIDAILQKVFTDTFTIDAILQDTFTDTFTIDAILQDTFTDTFTIDTILQKVFTDTFTIDAHLTVSGAITKTFTIDVILQDTFTDTFTIDTHLVKQFTDTFTIDAILQDTFTDTFTIDTILQKVFTDTFTIDTILQNTFTDTFTIDTILQKVFTDTFTIDTILQKVFTNTFTIDTILQDTFTDTFTIDAHITSSVSTTFTIDTHLTTASITKTFTIDTMLSGTFPFTVSIELGNIVTLKSLELGNFIAIKSLTLSDFVALKSLDLENFKV